MKQATVEPPPILRLRSDVPPALVAVVERMLAKDPDERYQTADELSQALVAALPTAARDRLELGRGLVAAARIVGGLVVVAGLALVAAVVLSRPPRVSVSAPIPDSVAQALRRLGVLRPGDAALYVFVPGGPDDTITLVVTRRAVTVATPRRVRSYPRDSVRVRYGLEPRRGPVLYMVLAGPGRRADTVFHSLSLRAVYAMTPRLGQLLGGDAARRTLRLNP